MENIVTVSVAPIYQKPSFHSEMVTQALLWEKVEKLDQQNDWLHVKLIDGYSGWIQKSYITFSKRNDFSNGLIIQERLASVYEKPLRESDIIEYLSMGTRIPSDAVLNLSIEPYIEIEYPNGFSAFLYLKRKPSFRFRTMAVRTGMKLIGTPYLWGGKSGFGFDCSGFVQNLFSTFGVNLPRDAHQQYEVLNAIDPESAKPGDLVFFKTDGKISHVGIYKHIKQFIHCSGCVKINSLVPDDELYENWIGEKFDSICSIEPLLKK